MCQGAWRSPSSAQTQARGERRQTSEGSRPVSPKIQRSYDCCERIQDKRDRKGKFKADNLAIAKKVGGKMAR